MRGQEHSGNAWPGARRQCVVRSAAAMRGQERSGNAWSGARRQCEVRSAAAMRGQVEDLPIWLTHCGVHAEGMHPTV